MTVDELKERVELLLSLPAEHPAYIKYLNKYSNYLTEHRKEIGVEYSDKMVGKLPSPIYKSAQNKIVVLCEAVKDLQVIERSISIQLCRLPISSYLFARTVASRFLQQINPASFVMPYERSLLLDVAFYQEKLAQFLKVLREAKDPFVYYARFRKTLIVYLVNYILLPEHVKPYIPVVSYFEDRVKETENVLALIDRPEGVSQMDKFGDALTECVEDAHGKDSLLRLMREGISFVLKLQDSEDDNDKRELNKFIAVSNASPEDVLSDFVYSLETGVEVIYCRKRPEVHNAQKLAQSILNIYSPELLLRTALNNVYEIRTCSVAYDREAVLGRTKANLNLLYTHGVIGFDSLQRYERQVEELI